MTAMFRYRAPRRRDELLELLAEYGERARVLAGGTDLLGDVRSGLARPAAVVDVKLVPGFGELAWSAAEGLVIRPGVTIDDVLRDERARSSYPLLAACAQDLASHQIRNRATVVGNVVNASPCADMAPALLCLGARAVISSQDSRREVPFTEFFTGAKRTVLRAGELLEEIVVPAQSAGARGSYRKLKRIKGHDLGIVGVAAMAKDGELRLGISSCAPTPLLVDGLTTRDPVDEVVAVARAAISPISDVRCTKEYRTHMVGVYVRRAMEEVA
ncbi:FAD binding domain-containing protein [Nocardioides sp. T2.26MG-1]|uniref:FAD binding domain-containing protein n=1 Tax=Nocardioides sp. T2.26MG-1 TaxID=3041166 RepID=UPI0024776C5B|nr:FAD binding domain-containing protein [Nocardioides sp. T2.26MG-1]CAI9412755.1 Carbon monoxide dehydrogenase medium chain [Nocardioides sp. T2.26MG-1]